MVGGSGVVAVAGRCSSCACCVARCEEVTSRFQDLYGPQVSQNTHSQLVLQVEIRLEGIIAETKNKLLKVSVWGSSGVERQSLAAATPCRNLEFRNSAK